MVDANDIDWNYWMYMAFSYAQLSRDPSTQNGAILVDTNNRAVGHGSNNFPNGVKESEERWERPIKYSFIEHAERNTILRAAFDGVKVNGTTLVCPWAACAECARAIVVSGVKTLIRCSWTGDLTHERWNQSVEWGDEIMNEGGVEIIDLDYKHPKTGIHINLRRNGELMVIK